MATSQARSPDFSALSNLKKGLKEILLAEGVAFFLLLPLLIWIPILNVALIIPAIHLYKLYNRHKQIQKDNQKVMAQFAKENGFVYTPVFAGGFDNDPGTLFTHGHSKGASDILSGDFAGFPFTLFRYNYSTGSGKSRRDYDAAVMEIKLPRVLPHMVIDSLVEDGNGSFSALPIEFDRSQRIELEGDFHNYFALYAPDKYGISALTIIAPDAMEALMRHAALCDIEIIDNKLYFYWPKVALTKHDYEEVFSTVQEVLAEIGNKLSRGDIFAHVSQEKVHAVASGQGVRLKKSGIRLLTVLGIMGYIGAQFVRTLDGIEGSIVGGAMFLVVMVVLLQFARRESRRRRLLKQLQARYDSYRSR